MKRLWALLLCLLCGGCAWVQPAGATLPPMEAVTPIPIPATAAAAALQPTLRPTPEPETALSLGEALTLAVGEGAAPAYIFDAAPGDTPVWTVSDGSVASVDDTGRVTGLAEGECTLRLASALRPETWEEIPVQVKETHRVSYVDGFYYEDISDEVFAGMEGKSYPADCTVPRESLCYLHVWHFDFEGSLQQGEMICSRAAAQDLLDLFVYLYSLNYPIRKMVLIDAYDASDDASMADDNTSCFNYRLVEGTDHLSRHALGLAVDFNPVENPFVRKGVASPEAGSLYIDRTLGLPGMIDEDDPIYQFLTARGWTWGGDFKSYKDYQHFQKPD